MYTIREAMRCLPYMLPGFGFHPTDQQLITHYLKRKAHDECIEFDIIPEVDIYMHEPWDLPGM